MRGNFFIVAILIFVLFAAHEGGHFTAEIAPIDVKGKKGKVSMTQDEHPRPQTTLEQMAKLSPVFKKGGTVTAANASVSPHKQIFAEPDPVEEDVLCTVYWSTQLQLHKKLLLLF